ncbi:MAG: hypothetical protein HYY45_21605 [Deltaproteobacteria bacterium]|nr:hypothetical protein [Deltaproteobacteria bacterium]
MKIGLKKRNVLVAALNWGFTRVIEGPEGYANFEETVKLYQEIFKTR